MLSHITFGVLALCILSSVYEGWIALTFFGTEIFSIVYFGVIILIDSLVRIISEKKENIEK